MHWKILCVVLFIAVEFPFIAKGQNDSLPGILSNSKIGKQLYETLTIEVNPDTVFNQKSESVFLPYDGMIIRHIYIAHVGFERTLYDSTQRLKNIMVKAGNALHSNTKEWAIHDNLFIYENTKLNPYRLADNERYLRDRDFLLDARIEVRPVEKTDSVDLVIYTRDVFSLGGRFSPHSADKYKFRLYDVNLAGWGQSVAFNGLFDAGRTPEFGPEFIYQKSSVGGSLANVSAGYTTLNSGSSYGEEEEAAYYLRVDRPLVSPYTRLAGGLELSRNWSKNYSGRTDSVFRDYRYYIYDAWVGYNIGIHNQEQNRSRHFVSLRWFHQDFGKHPQQAADELNPQYNDNSFVLANITFFKQDFYKTRFIYGFGRTEDVPYGHRVVVGAGLAKQLDRERPYGDIEVEKIIAQKKGDFLTANARLASYFNHGPEDATFQLYLEWFSRLRPIGRLHFRQSLRSSYTTHVKRTFNDLLELGDRYGVRGFRTDSLFGYQRLGFSAETVLFTRWKLLGFKFATVGFADLAFLDVDQKGLFYNIPFAGIGAAVRTRNENLTFGTIELRFTYFPRTVENIDHFKIGVSTNLRVKYSGSFVRKPTFFFYN